MRNPRATSFVLALIVLSSACGGGGDAASDGAGTDSDSDMGSGMDKDSGMGSGMGGDDPMGSDSMGRDSGMGALGGSARTVLLDESTVDSLGDGPLAWSAFVVSDVEHEHPAAFVHAVEATTVTISDDAQELEEGSAMFVPAGTPHRHGPGTAWDVLLAPPDVEQPAGITGDAVFRSDRLEGLPEGEAQLRALLVELPPDAQTSVHTHPGPEYIYATRGRFVYQNGIIGESETTEGDDHTLPGGVPVQKRNPPGGDEAAFLSWFVVARDEPFAPSASFDR